MSITQDFRVDTGLDFYLNQNPLIAPAQHLISFIKRHTSGRKILDFGCGIGAYAYELQHQGFQVTGIDANPAYVDIARSNGIDALLITDGKLPFADGLFDTSFAIEVLEHLPDEILRKVIPEIRRVTRGNFLATVPDNTSYHELLPYGFMFGHYQALDHVQFFTQSNLRALLINYFASVEVTRGDPVFPHLLLPPIARRPVSLLYRLGVIRPTLFARLFAVATPSSASK